MTATKSNILSAAEELIAVNGIKDTTIAAIARKAGVADSLAYQFFKGKEDLLFAVADKRIQEALEILEEHLQGITDDWSRLSKMIWHGLQYNDRHPGYVRILLFECRSNKNFYTTPAYKLMRKHAGIVLSVLRQGVENGSFCSRNDMGLVRDIIYGTLDFSAISCLAAKETRESKADLNDIMSILRAMIAPRDREVEISKEERILNAAEQEFARSGYNGAKVSEIAKLAGVSEGTVYECFKNKEELLLSIPARRLKDHLKDLPETFHIKSPLRKLRRLMRYHFSQYMPNRDFLRVFLLDVQLNIRFYNSPVYKYYQKYCATFEKVIEEGRKEGSFRQDVNPRVFRNMFLGAFSHIALRWLMLTNGEEIDKMKEIDQIVDLFTEAVLPTGVNREEEG